MPKYVYHCSECDGSFETVHGMMERQDHCELCYSSSCLRRIPQMPHIKTFDSEIEENHPVGFKVREAIRENAELLKQQKKEALSQEWSKDE
jgi:hypothetical protein